MKRWLAALFCSASLVACQTGSSSASLRVGMDTHLGLPFIAPLENETVYTGFEYDLAEYLATKLGRSLEIVDTPWERLLERLSAGKADLVLSSMEKPSQRQEQTFLYSTHYYTTYQKLSVRSDDNFTYNLSDLKGEKVGVIEGSVSELLIEDLNKMKNAAIQLQPFLEPQGMFEALAAGELIPLVSSKAS